MRGLNTATSSKAGAKEKMQFDPYTLLCHKMMVGNPELRSEWEHGLMTTPLFDPDPLVMAHNVGSRDQISEIIQRYRIVEDAK